MTTTSTDLLIVGAGPFGLSMAAHARHLGIEHIVVGEPMRFWRANMPGGMYLRSACDWHLDPEHEDTIEAFLDADGLRASDVEPLSRDRYLDYTRWFQARKRIEPWPAFVERLDAVDDGRVRFQARLAGGDVIAARHVVLALGFAPFPHVPEDVARQLPRGCAQHTCDLVDFTALRGQRCLIVGGRQSAFEWAALMHEAGAAAVHVAHRHGTPAFATSDWSWVTPLVNAIAGNPGWYRRLEQAERDALGRRLWAEGRLKLEPWLAPRVYRDGITLWPNARMAGGRARADRTVAVTLDGPDGARELAIDRVVLATGYKVDITRVPLLSNGNLLARLATDGGAPALDDYLQSSVPGLFITSFLATRDFGPFFAFTVAARASAQLIGQALTR